MYILLAVSGYMYALVRNSLGFGVARVMLSLSVERNLWACTASTQMLSLHVSLDLIGDAAVCSRYVQGLIEVLCTGIKASGLSKPSTDRRVRCFLVQADSQMERKTKIRRYE